MNAILTHYENGSASPDWIRAMVQIETERHIPLPEALPIPMTPAFLEAA